MTERELSPFRESVVSHAIRCRPESVFRGLAGTAALLLAINAVLQCVAAATGHNSIYGLRPTFDVSLERTIPAFFSSVMLLFSGALLLLMATCHRRRGERFPRLWQLLGLVFVYLAIDESVGFHEKLSEPMSLIVSNRGPLHFTWVAAAIPLLCFLGLVYFRALWALPSRTRWQVILAGGMFVGGAVGLEMLGGWYIQTHSRDLVYHGFSAVEESLEMFGVIVFIRALLEYLGRQFPDSQIWIDASGGTPA